MNWGAGGPRGFGVGGPLPFPRARTTVGAGERRERCGGPVGGLRAGP